MKERPEVGDIAEISWLDHFRFQGEIPTQPWVVKTWGKIAVIDDNGIAVIQNEVQEPVDDVHRVMDGQFILKNTVQEIVIFKKGGLNGE